MTPEMLLCTFQSAMIMDGHICRISNSFCLIAAIPTSVDLSDSSQLVFIHVLRVDQRLLEKINRSLNLRACRTWNFLDSVSDLSQLCLLPVDLRN